MKKVVHHAQVGLTPGMEEGFNIRISVNMIDPINKSKDKKHMKISTSIRGKALDKLGIEGTYLKMRTSRYDKPRANFILNGEKPKAFPPGSGPRQGHPLSPPLISLASDIPATAMRQ